MTFPLLFSSFASIYPWTLARIGLTVLPAVDKALQYDP